MQQKSIRKTAPVPVLVLMLVLAGCAGSNDHESGAGHHSPQPDSQPAAQAPQAKHGGHNKHSGHGHHRFEKAADWIGHFENDERDEWQRPDIVIAKLGLQEDSRVADIGSATGYFPIRIAKQVPNGRVWGIDIEADMVRHLNARAREEGISNLFSVLGSADDPLIPEPVDVILMVNTYHHIESRPEYFRRLQSKLRPGGRLVIVDYKMGQFPSGPPEHMRLQPEVVTGELEAAGYQTSLTDTESLPRQYILAFTVSAPPSSPSPASTATKTDHSPAHSDDPH
jgi:SAM-dependent methyltransferase